MTLISRWRLRMLFVISFLCPFPPAALAQTQPIQAADNPRTTTGEVGQRQTREATFVEPMMRIESRIEQRLPSRIDNRIDRNYQADYRAAANANTTTASTQLAPRTRPR